MTAFSPMGLSINFNYRDNDGGNEKKKLSPELYMSEKRQFFFFWDNINVFLHS